MVLPFAMAFPILICMIRQFDSSRVTSNVSDRSVRLRSHEV